MLSHSMSHHTHTHYIVSQKIESVPKNLVTSEILAEKQKAADDRKLKVFHSAIVNNNRIEIYL